MGSIIKYDCDSKCPLSSSVVSTIIRNYIKRGEITSGCLPLRNVALLVYLFFLERNKLNLLQYSKYGIVAQTAFSILQTQQTKKSLCYSFLQCVLTLKMVFLEHNVRKKVKLYL